MLQKIHSENPQDRLIDKVVTCLKNGGIIIYPTDTVYGLGCDITNKKAIERICKIKGIKPEKATFSCICESFATLSEYTNQIDNQVFKILKRALPGPYTFIFKASKKIPRHFITKRKTVGIRIIDNPISQMIVEKLGNPLLSTSIYSEDIVLEYAIDPELIHDRYSNLVDIVIDGGFGENVPSTIIDVSGGYDELEVIREGKDHWIYYKNGGKY